MLRFILLIVWTTGILVPLFHVKRGGYLTSLLGMDFLKSNWTHILAHFFLFAVFAFLLAHVLARAGVEHKKLGNLVPVCVLALGVLQEILQSFAVGGFMGSNQYFDILVDVIGGLTGLVLYRCPASATMRRL